MDTNLFQRRGILMGFLAREMFIVGQKEGDEPVILQVLTAEMLSKNEQHVTCALCDVESSRWNDTAISFNLIKVADVMGLAVSPAHWLLAPTTSAQEEAISKISKKPALLLSQYIATMGLLLKEKKFDEAARTIVALHDASVGGDDWYEKLLVALSNAYFDFDTAAALMAYWKEAGLDERNEEILKKFIVNYCYQCGWNNGNKDEGSPFDSQ